MASGREEREERERPEREGREEREERDAAGDDDNQDRKISFATRENPNYRLGRPIAKALDAVFEAISERRGSQDEEPAKEHRGGKRGSTSDYLHDVMMRR